MGDRGLSKEGPMKSIPGENTGWRPKKGSFLLPVPLGLHPPERGKSKMRDKMQRAKEYTEEDYLRIVAIIEEKIDPDELRDIARSALDFDDFSEMVLNTVLSRVEWGWEGIQSAWPNPVIQEFLEEVYREARAGVEEIPPPAPRPPEKPPAPAKPPEEVRPPAPTLWDRIKRGIRRIFGR